MPTFDALEVSWLRAAKQAFEHKPIVKPFGRGVFVDALKGVLASVTDKSKRDDLLDKINKISTDEFWEFYWRDFA
jgi:hypothetical protein